MEKVAPCEICGDVGFGDCILSCARCKISRQHVYCLRSYSLEPLPEIWSCEDCTDEPPASNCRSLELAVVPPTSPDRDGGVVLPLEFGWKGKRPRGVRLRRCPREAPCLLMIEQKGAPISSGKKKKKELKHVKSRHDGREIVMGLKCCSAGKPPLPPRRSSLRKKKPKLNFSGDAHYDDAKAGILHIQETHPFYNLLHFEKYPSNLPNPAAAWKGRFEIVNIEVPIKVYGGFQAHYPKHPYISGRSIYEVSNQMPEVLQFKPLPRKDIWAQIFDSDFANGWEISIYFFPGSSNWSVEQYVSLLSLMEKEDLVMRSCMNGVELLVFTSKQLQFAKDLNWIPFLWGLFRKKKNAPASDVGTMAIVKKHVLKEVKIELDDLAVPPGFAKKVESKADLAAIAGSSSVMVEIPVKHDQALVHALATRVKAALDPTLPKWRSVGPRRGAGLLKIRKEG